MIAVPIVIVAAVIAIIIAASTIPEAASLSIESASDSQTLTWKGKPKGISYQIYRREGSGDAEFELAGTIPEGGEHSFVSSGLDSAVLYEYKVVAVKGSGEKVRESKGSLVRAYTLPETITGARAETLSKESLTVSWPDIPRATGYEIRYGTDESFSGEQILSLKTEEIEKNATTGENQYQIGSLPVGSVYYFTIRAVAGEELYALWSDTFSGEVTPAVDMTGIDVNRPMVALTYDDGPDGGDVTNRILDALKSVGGHATFFQLGQLCENYPEVTNRIIAEGHEIGCHTYDHTHYGASVTREDIIRGNDAIEAVCGIRPPYFRATGGEMTDLIRSVCTEERQSLYRWDVDTRDWSSRDADAVMREIQASTSDGCIILMHNIYASTAEATEEAVQWLTGQGYQLVTVGQLIQAKTGRPPVAGTEYFNATRTD